MKIYELEPLNLQTDLFPVICLIVILVMIYLQKNGYPDIRKHHYYFPLGIAFVFTLAAIPNIKNYWEWRLSDKQGYSILKGPIEKVESDGRKLYIHIDKHMVIYSRYTSSCLIDIASGLHAKSVVEIFYKDEEGYEPDCIAKVIVHYDPGLKDDYIKVLPRFNGMPETR